MPYEKNELYNLCIEMVFEKAGLILFGNDEHSTYSQTRLKGEFLYSHFICKLLKAELGN